MSAETIPSERAENAERRANRWRKAATASAVTFGVTGVCALLHVLVIPVWGVVAVAHIAIALRWMQLHNSAIKLISAEKEAAARYALLMQLAGYKPVTSPPAPPPSPVATTTHHECIPS